MNFSETKDGILAKRMIAKIEDLYQRETDLHEKENLLATYKLVQNVFGNVKAIWETYPLEKRPRTVSLAAIEDRMQQKMHLRENLTALWDRTSSHQTCNDDIKTLIKKYYSWNSVNNTIKRLISRNGNELPYSGKLHLDTQSKILKFINYTDEEMLELIHLYPYLSIIYSGNDVTIKNVGTLMR
jgi:hypothetical protein